jgi:hypothetical protein
VGGLLKSIDAPAITTLLALDVAEAEPPLLVTVIITLKYFPISDAIGV